MEIALSSRQACEVAGITYRKVDWWARTGIVLPSLVDAAGSGSRRRYSVEDVRLLAVVGRVTETSPRAELAPLGRALDGLAVVEDWTGWVYLDARSGAVGRSPEILGGSVGWVLDLGRIDAEVQAGLDLIVANAADDLRAAETPAARPNYAARYARPPARPGWPS